MKKAVVLLSGGIDSTTALTIAKAQGFEIHALSFDYGQRHKIELQLAALTAKEQCAAQHLVINFDLRRIGGSALTSDMEVPKREKSEELRVMSNKGKPESDLIPVTYVPARNTIFLSFALGWAEVLAAEDIFIGANAIDYSGYPDCRPEFLKAFEDMANLATKASVEGKCRFRIHAPLIALTKHEIIKMGSGLGIDFSKTWSCYDPQKAVKAQKRKHKEETDHITDFRPCGKCDSCLLREKGFREAGIRDPLRMTE